MPNPTGKGGKKWVKGQPSANPTGRPKLPAELREFKQTSYEDFLNALQKYGNMTSEALVAEMKRPECTLFERMFGNMVAQAAAGDHDARKLLLDRVWGKPQEIDINIQVTQMGTPELLERARQTIKQIECLEAEVVESKTPDKN